MVPKNWLPLALLLALCFTNSIMAQSSSTGASITGVITDEQNSVIGGANIVVKNLKTNLVRQVQSNEDGSFLIPQLPPSDYEITVQLDGFNTKSLRTDLELGTTILINCQLQLGATSDIIEVNASSNVDQGKTESSSNNDRGRIDNLPINRRDFLNFSLTSPRVVADRVPVQGVTSTSGLSFNGQSARSNNITIDGLENNDLGPGSVRATFSQEAVQEFQVVSDSFSAEFGRALGGIVNIVTRGGGNETHGGIFFLYRNDSLSSRNAFAPVNPTYKQYQFGNTLSGAIKQDHTFYFTSFERLTIKQSNIVTIGNDTVAAANRLGFPLRNGALPFSLGNTTALARIDTKLTPNNLFYLRYNFGGIYNGALETFGGLVGNTSAGVQKLDDHSAAINNTYINTSLNLVNEFRFLYGHRDQDVISDDPGPQVRIAAPEGAVQFGRGTFVPQARQERIFQFVNIVTLSRDIHQVKIGADYLLTRFLKERTTVPLFPGGVINFMPVDFTALSGIPNLPTLTALEAFDPSLRSPAQQAFLTVLSGVLPTLAPGFPTGVDLVNSPLPLIYAQGFGDTRLPVAQKLFSAFVQDDIKVKENLTLKAGIRYDISRISFSPENQGNFSPRLGLVYRPSKLPLTLRAAYGVYFGTPIAGTTSLVKTTGDGILKIPVIPFPFSILPLSQPGRKFPDGNQVPNSINFIPQLSTVFDFQPDLRNSYSQQANLTIDYVANTSTLFSATYNYLRGVKLFGLRNINPVVRPTGNQVTSLMTGRVFPDQGEIAQFETAFDSYYHGLTLALTRRFATNFNLQAYYTLSKVIDNTSDIRNDQLEVQDQLNPGAERGLSLQDVRNRLVVSGTWDINYTKNRLIKDFQLSTIITLNSGRPYNLLVGQDLDMNGDINAIGDRPLRIGRNTGISRGFANMDLRLTRTLKATENIRFQVFVEAFNLFNRVNISDIDRLFPPDAKGNFLLPPKENGRFIITPDRFRGAFDPRQFQIGGKITF